MDEMDELNFLDALDNTVLRCPLRPDSPCRSVQGIILETAVQDDKVMQDFELESLLMGVIIPKR
jgi:hypothetical protein